MRKVALSMFKSNASLTGYLKRSAHLHSHASRRGAFEIAVIDDQPFAPLQNLQAYGYKIAQVGDLKKLNEIEQYPLILCDIMGVGRNFDSKLQGASIISEIKKSHPEKVVIAYTGAGLQEFAARQAIERADHLIIKDADIEDWVETLDNYAEEALDPYIVWNKLRRRFVEMDVSTRDIFILEDAYVRSVEAKDAGFNGLLEVASQSAQKDARAIVQSLIASVIFKVMFSA